MTSDARALAEHGLRPELPEVTGLAAGGRLAQLRQRRPLRHERRGRAVAAVEEVALRHAPPIPD
jgi:hypothetical protein